MNVNERIGRRALAPPGGVTTANIFGSLTEATTSGTRYNDEVAFKLLKLALIECVVSSRNETTMRTNLHSILGSRSARSGVAESGIRAPLPTSVRSVTPVGTVSINVAGEEDDSKRKHTTTTLSNSVEDSASVGLISLVLITTFVLLIPFFISNF